MPVLNEKAQSEDQQTLAGKEYPFKSLIPCDLRQFKRRYERRISNQRSSLSTYNLEHSYAIDSDACMVEYIIRLNIYHKISQIKLFSLLVSSFCFHFSFQPTERVLSKHL